MRLEAENYILMLQLPITYDGPITLIEMLSYERILKTLREIPSAIVYDDILMWC